MLLDAGADVEYGDPLSAASTYSHERVVQILLNAGAIVGDGIAVHAATWP